MKVIIMGEAVKLEGVNDEAVFTKLTPNKGVNVPFGHVFPDPRIRVTFEGGIA